VPTDGDASVQRSRLPCEIATRCHNNFVNLKKNPNHRRYLEVLRRMTPEQRLLKALDLSAFSRDLFVHGLHERFPNLSSEEFHKLLLARLEKCHNRNY
jgi:hypothetical protein